jgi:hypothetical protein
MPFRRVTTPLLALLLLTTTAHAFNTPTYDLDSLVYLSSDIVETTVDAIQPVPGNPGDLRAQVTVTRVAAGAHHVHEVLTVTDVPFYVVRSPDQRNVQRITPGARVWLFLQPPPVPLNPANPLPPGNEQPVLSGVHLIDDSRVITPFQSGNPGPFLFVLPSPGGPTEEQFRAQLADSIARMADLRDRLKKPPAPTDVQWLVPALRARPVTDGIFRDDALAKPLADRLAGLNDPAAFLEIVDAPIGARAGALLATAMQQRATRAYFAAHLADLQIPLTRRLRLLDTLQRGGPDINRSTTLTVEDLHALDAGIDPSLPENGHYLQHLAETAASPAAEPQLARAILRTLRAFSTGPLASAAPPVHADLLRAVHALEPLYRRADDPETLFLIELLANQFNIAQQHHIPVSPIIGFTRQTPPDPQHPLAPGDLAITLDLFTPAPLPDAAFTFELVLRPAAGPDIRLPLRGDPLVFPPGQPYTAGLRTETVPLPASLPPGQYHLFTRISRHKRLVTETRGFDLSLP